MEYKKQYSKELARVINYIDKVLVTEYPTYRISFEYFLLAILEEKASNAYEIIEKNVLTNNIDTTRMFLVKYISSKAITQPIPNKKIVFEENLDNILKKLGDEDNGDGIYSEDVISEIFKSNSKVKRTLIKMGVNASKFKRVGVEIEFERDIMNEKEINSSTTNAQTKEISKQIVKRASGDTKSNKTPNIDRYTENLTIKYKKGLLTPLVGMEKELYKSFQIMNKQSSNNIIYVGDSGVGKTTMINGIIQNIEELSVPSRFMNRTVVKLKVNDVISGLSFKDLLDERMRLINDEFYKSDSYILLIEDIHLYVSDRYNNMFLSIVEPLLENDNLHIILTCNIKKFKASFENNPSLSKYFEKILIEPSSVKETINIINKNKHLIEKFHNVKFSNEIVELATNLAERYITDKCLPHSAISFIDMVGSDVNIKFNDNQDFAELYSRLNEISDRKDNANQNEKYDTVDFLSKKERGVRQEINKKMLERGETYEVVESDLYRVITSLTDIPINKLDNELSNLKNIDKILKSRVIGQDTAIDKICAGIKRKQVGLGGKNKPLSFMCIGQSGVGKTLLAKTIAKELLGSENNLVRYDMSEFSERHTISKLIGSPPGYVGYESGGSLTETIKHKKHCVLLLDEIEKACPEVFNVFLQLLDDGFLTDSSGIRFDFSNVIVIMTSNVGTKKSMEFAQTVGFKTIENNANQIIDKEFKKLFPPEFINRLTDVLFFENLGEEDLKKIINLNLKQLDEELNGNGFSISWSKRVVDVIYNNMEKEKGYGARPINRYIEREIESKIIDMIIDNNLKDYTFKLKTKQNELIVT